MLIETSSHSKTIVRAQPQHRAPYRASDLVLWHFSDLAFALRDVRFLGDCVAKLFSQHGHKFSEL